MAIKIKKEKIVMVLFAMDTLVAIPIGSPDIDPLKEIIFALAASGFFVYLAIRRKQIKISLIDVFFLFLLYFLFHLLFLQRIKTGRFFIF